MRTTAVRDIASSAVLIASLVLPSSVLGGQTAAQALDRLTENSRKLADVEFKGNENLENLRASVQVLKDGTKSSIVRKEFTEGLVADADALERVKSVGLTADRKKEILEAVAKDLSIKADQGKSDTATSPIQVVDVEVATKAQAKEIQGCEVMFVLVAWKDTKERFSRFPKESSPTKAKMAPGYYEMWTRKGHSEGERCTVIVRGANVDEQRIDLPAPVGQ